MWARFEPKAKISSTGAQAYSPYGGHAKTKMVEKEGSENLFVMGQDLSRKSWFREPERKAYISTSRTGSAESVIYRPKIGSWRQQVLAQAYWRTLSAGDGEGLACRPKLAL